MEMLKCEGSKHRHPNQNKGTVWKDEQPWQLRGPAVPRRCPETDPPETPGWQHPTAAAHPAPASSKGSEMVGSGQQFCSCFLMATSAPEQPFALQQQHGQQSPTDLWGKDSPGPRAALSPIPTPGARHQAETGHSQDGEWFCSIP